MPKQLTWRKAIEKILSEAPGAIHYTDLTDKIIEEGLRTSIGATPSATVAAQLSDRINKEVATCPFQKVGRGLYIWKQKAGITVSPQPAEVGTDEEEVQYEIVSSFGMFWRRNAIE